MQIPSLADVLRIHDRMLELGGGEPGVLNVGAVESALHRAAWGPFSRPDLCDRAALLLRGLCQDHPFADGNKRTAFESADFLLALNGHALHADEAAIVTFMLEVAQERLSVAEIAHWMRGRLEKS